VTLHRRRVGAVRLRAAAIAAASAALIVAGCAKHRVLVPAPTPTPTPFAISPLDGTAVAPNSIRHRIDAVVVDNYPDARPQSGLRDADVVYEVEAEGGITRYLALFLERSPKIIGPVRSARLYLVDLARPYDPYFAHAGENDDVWGPLADLRSSGFADMEQIVGVPEAFWRDDSRYMPHNLYTSIARMRAAGPQHGWPDRPFEGQEFAYAHAPSVASDPHDVTLTFWNDYHVRYHWVGGAYERLVDGIVQHDREERTPYRVADVIVTWIPATVIDQLGDLRMTVYGKFSAMAIRDGHAALGYWVAAGPDILPALENGSGESIALSPGQIYVEVLPQGGSVTIGKNTWSH